MDDDGDAVRPGFGAAFIQHACRWPFAVLAVATLCALAPSLIFGVGRTHDFFVHYQWAEEFADVLLRGEAYPRWLPGIGDGLGSPAFYYYAPLPYYVCALVEGLTFHAFPTQHVMAVASALFLFGSGAAMFLWLRRFAAPFAALLGAVGFIVAPYHLFADHYYRGAFGEFATFMFLPLIALALHDVQAGARWGIAKLTLAYAGLMYCHVLTSILATLFLVGPYTLFLAVTAAGNKQRICFVLSGLLAGMCGVALAAPVLLPAASLQHHISAEKWDLYTALDFLPILPHRWADREMMLLYTFGALGWLVTMGAVAWSALKLAPRSVDLLFWSLLSVCCALLILGLPIPAFWTLPVIERVQFSWRLNTVLEFGAITSLVLAGPLWRSLLAMRAMQAGVLIGLIGALAFGAIAARNVLSHIRHGDETLAAVRATHFDAPEYLPAGFWSAGVSLGGAIAQPPLAASAGNPRLLLLHDDLVRIEADPEVSGSVALRRFYFPSWVAIRERDGARIVTRPSEPYKFISFEMDAGETYTIRREILPVEELAWQIAAIAAAVSLLGAALVWVGARRARHRFASDSA